MLKCTLYNQTESKKFVLDADAVPALDLIWVDTLQHKFYLETYYNDQDVELYTVSAGILEGNIVRIIVKDLENEKAMRIDTGFMNSIDWRDPLYTEIVVEDGLDPMTGLEILKKILEDQPDYKELLERIKEEE